MNKIYIKPFNGNTFYNNKLFKINNGHNIFYNIKNKIDETKYIINTSDFLKDQSDILIFCDLPYPWDFKSWKILLFSKSKKILFVFESPLVNPFNHLKFIYNLFDSVYTWDNSVIKTNRVHSFRIPQVNPEKIYNTPYDQKEYEITLINSNKSSPQPFKWLSPYKFDGYNERLKAINYFESNHSHKFNLFGKGWNAPQKIKPWEKYLGFKKYKTYKGAPDNKFDILSKSKFSICYENAIAPGYFTEKIFDCLIAGCVPIYLGAPDIEKYIPKECMINKNDFNSYNDLNTYINNLKRDEYNNIISEGQKFISDPKVKSKFYEDYFYNLFMEAIRI